MPGDPRLMLLAVGSSCLLAASAASAAPTSVTIAGDLQSELGCSGDWQPDCATTHLATGSDSVWRGTWTVPAGDWQYKAALNDSWDVNYGANATAGGSNIPLSLSTARSVRFYYDDVTHWITDNQNSVIAAAAGDFQSELGCAGDWDPSCLRSWLEDPTGSGTYSFTTTALPAGNYQAKVAIGESWDENYGASGVRDGINIAFTVTDRTVPVVFQYNPATHVLTITGATVTTPTYSFAGFFAPVDNPPVVNTANAGQVIALKFGLGGDKGLDIFQAGYPTSRPVACQSAAVEDVIEQTVSAVGSGLVYDASTGQYAYLWKTQRSWKSTCREFVMKLADGSIHTALFHFKQ